MRNVVDKLGQALIVAACMAWQTGWTLVLGFRSRLFLQTIR